MICAAHTQDLQKHKGVVWEYYLQSMLLSSLAIPMWGHVRLDQMETVCVADHRLQQVHGLWMCGEQTHLQCWRSLPSYPQSDDLCTPIDDKEIQSVTAVPSRCQQSLSGIPTRNGNHLKQVYICSIFDHLAMLVCACAVSIVTNCNYSIKIGTSLAHFNWFAAWISGVIQVFPVRIFLQVI